MLDNNGGFGPNSEANNLWGQDLANGFFSMQSSQDSHQHLFASTIPSVSSNNTTRTQGLPAIQGAEDSPLRAFGLLGTSTTASTTTTAYAPRFAVPPVLGGMPPLSNGEDSDCGVQEIKDAYEFRITGEPSKSSRIENQIRLTFTIQPKAKVCCVPLLHSQCPSRWTTLKLPQDLCNNYHSYDPNSIQQQQTLGPGPGPGTAMGPMHAIATSIPQIGVPTATAAEAAAGTGTGRAGRQGTQLICDTKVYCASRLARAGGSFDEIDEIFCCANCSNRERKTEERKATKKRQKGVGIAVAASSSPAGSAEGMRFTQRRARSIILFCCDSEVPIVKNEFTIPLRLTCYCSHFDERIGFRILFTFTDKASGEVVGSALSEPICIKDEHKNNERRLKRQRANNAAANPASTPGGTPKPPTSSEQQQQQQQQTPGPQQADAHPLRQGALPVEQTLRTFQGHQEEQELTPPPPPQQQQITLPMAASAVGGMNMCMGEGCFVGMKPVLYPPGPMQPPMLQGQVEAPGLYGGNPGFTSFQVSDSTGPTTPEGYYNGAPLFTTAAGSMCNHPVIALPTAGPLGTIVQQQQQQQQQQLGPPPLMAGLPRVMKVVPQDGPVAGGVSVMVAGVGFTPQCTLWFGEYQSHDTQMWNDGAMFCTLPPALRPEVVPVSVNQPQPRGVILDSSVQYFEYRDDTELRMYRQALLTVGGKLFGSSVSPAQVATSLAGKQRHVAAGGPGNGDTEGVVLRALDAANRVRVEGQPERRLDLTLKETGTGRTLLHLAAIKGYDALSLWLMNNDLQSFLVNERDCLGNTPLHYAAFYGHPNT